MFRQMERRETIERDGVLYIKCNKCWEFKEATNEFFDKCHTWFMWLQWSCKVCTRAKQKEYCHSHKDMIKKNRKTLYERDKDKVKARNKKRRNENRLKLKEYVIKHYAEKSNQLWFDWGMFHKKARDYVRKHKIKPQQCPICWCMDNIVMHHPSYLEEDWNKVVFCCQWCHISIHTNQIKCPEPINILDL